MSPKQAKDTRWTQFVPRRVYDKYQDRMEIRLARLKEDNRNDLLALVKRLNNLEAQLDRHFPIEEEQTD